ncbi:hypothetical protein GCK72_008771 [Caenorhabditis remanei]|uniref:Uncharacterized protein n=1 Tax=Caenorhabditis remanei TaxID=31234 RepID=A0A6A5H223_CAERE|nr:hypothetical protein GCK72_008768 [Caenorhabditis remanei]XP_053586613.1 hypothetical protein GCK72_008771 [Caenorhabditis remanei]KAF1760519.1 hypothetical protein GCK72_008768 [Caenorhabditis remanei]KAF1760522.1 hypothetical protein GCK72_008771 [Caenorhabditis remanei]
MSFRILEVLHEILPHSIRLPNLSELELIRVTGNIQFDFTGGLIRPTEVWRHSLLDLDGENPLFWMPIHDGLIWIRIVLLTITSSHFDSTDVFHRCRFRIFDFRHFCERF